MAVKVLKFGRALQTVRHELKYSVWIQEPCHSEYFGVCVNLDTGVCVQIFQCTNCARNGCINLSLFEVPRILDY